MSTENFSDCELVALRPALMAFARSFVRTPNDAEDLVQETLLRALSFRHQFHAGTRLKSWLFTIMRNTFYNEAVRVKREHPGYDECVSERRSVAAPQEMSQLLFEVSNRIDNLSPAFREALILVAIGDSCEEVASQVGCAVGTVKSRVSRARRLILNHNLDEMSQPLQK
jgi:RNA polymerase sigma factor (sigma-70 family)